MPSAIDLLSEWLAEGVCRSCRVDYWNCLYNVHLDIDGGRRKKHEHYYGQSVELDAAIRAAIEKARRG